MSAMQPFDLLGPMPTGVTLLEASAGTGKTYTVGALVARAIAEGHVTMDQLLVITFTRAASQELRERVRGQLVRAEAALADPSSVDGDEFLSFLAEVKVDERAARRERVRDALAGFDMATISTTHQFCQTVLKSLGVAGDLDPGVELVESLADLVEEVVDDLYLARFGWSDVDPPFSRASALTIGRDVIGDPHAEIAAPDSPDQWSPKVAFAHAVRAEIERRKRRLGILSYDDLLSRLAEALRPGDFAGADPLAKTRMADRWRMVLVDEFQDTDPVQWQVLHAAFSESTMILIGDPKQAIYGFRGGDIVAYLEGVTTADTKATLSFNFRSDPELVRCLGAMFSGAELGDPRIVAQPPVPALVGRRLLGAPSPAPLRLRVVARDGLRRNRDGTVAAASAREFVARDCAADIARLLNSGARFGSTAAVSPGVQASPRALLAADVAVLVASREHGMAIARALSARGVHSVVAGAGQVMRTPAADEWMTLLDALEQPHHSGRVRAAALTSFFGHTMADLDHGGDALTDRMCEEIRDLAALTRTKGVAGLFARLDQLGVSRRTLAQPEGARHLTDLRHLAETLHGHSVREGFGLAAITAWMREERRTAVTATERTRRLDTDAAAVQIVTIHGAKGLQFPVVYVPFAFDNYRFPITVAKFHDEAGTRMIGIDPAQDDWPTQTARHLAEEAGEELRELYVALTRGQSQVVTWWAPSGNVKASALHRLLLGRTPNAPTVPPEAKLRSDEEAWAIFEQWAALGGPACERAVIGDDAYAPALSGAAGLGVRRFDRTIDFGWRRTSYSGLIRAEEAAVGVSTESPSMGTDDEGPELVLAVGADVERGDDAGLAMASPMADLPVGATFGSLVHAILEHVDPGSADLVTALTLAAVDHLRWWPVEARAEQLAAALQPVVHTPLGPLASGATLAQLGVGNRLCELDFEFPLAGGDDTVREVWLGELADLVEQHLPVGDVIRPYAARLRAPGLARQSLKGYLSGSIDVVLRAPVDRYLVVDYKTNRLGDPGQPMLVGDYCAEAMADAMTHSHYPLQAMIYSVVLHRFLRWRLPGYDPAVHLGGVLYLYVRGMAGPTTPVAGDGSPCGVFSWHPPVAFVEALSDWLAGGRSNEA